MKRVSYALCFSLSLILILFLPATSAWSKDTTSAIVTADKLNSRIKEVEAATSL